MSLPRLSVVRQFCRFAASCDCPLEVDRGTRACPFGRIAISFDLPIEVDPEFPVDHFEMRATVIEGATVEIGGNDG